jgi:hypothetical protein
MTEQNPQMRPASKELAPDPATVYERAKPEKEAGMGRLDNNVGTPEQSPDRIEQAVTHKQDPERQINAEDVLNERNARPADGTKINPPESMAGDEPLGWDQAPGDIHDSRRQRQPKTEGKGGTP